MKCIYIISKFDEGNASKRYFFHEFPHKYSKNLIATGVNSFIYGRDDQFLIFLNVNPGETFYKLVK